MTPITYTKLHFYLLFNSDIEKLTFKVWQEEQVNEMTKINLLKKSQWIYLKNWWENILLNALFLIQPTNNR